MFYRLKSYRQIALNETTCYKDKTNKIYGSRTINKALEIIYIDIFKTSLPLSIVIQGKADNIHI